MTEGFLYLVLTLGGTLAAGAYGYLLGYEHGHAAALAKLWRPWQETWWARARR